MLSNRYLDLPKGAEWMIRGACTPSFRIKQHPFEDACTYKWNKSWAYNNPRIPTFDPDFRPGTSSRWCQIFAFIPNSWNKTHKNMLSNRYLDLPKGAEWMIRGAYTPSFRIKQHPNWKMLVYSSETYAQVKWDHLRIGISKNQLKWNPSSAEISMVCPHENRGVGIETVQGFSDVGTRVVYLQQA